MAGFLLNGWRVFVPGRDGRPLHDGKVCFYNAGSSTPANVFSDKELTVPYGTELPLDNSGFLPPNVWLETTHLYKCVVKQKIQNDPETWHTMWVIDDVGYIDEFALDFSDTLRFVNSIAELKALVPGTYDYVYVMGWAVPGDTGSPMAFKWEASSTDDSDDGHWITPASEPASGRWEQLFNDGFVDPRKFGAIPDTDELVDDAIVRAMLYAAEPNTFDPISEIIYRPKEVRFVRSGNYKIGGSIDFSIYKMIQGYGNSAVPVTVCSGVVFTSEEDVTVTFGNCVRIEGSESIVGGSTSLNVNEGCVEFVRPQWWPGNDMAKCLKKAASTNNDVRVFGDVSRFNHTIAANTTVSGNGKVTFVSPVFRFDIGVAGKSQKITYECLVEAPEERMIYGSTNLTSQPFSFENDKQVVKDTWFRGGDYNSALGFCLDSSARRKFEIYGGRVTEDISPDELCYCKFNGLLEIDGGAEVSNVVIENGPEKILDVESGVLKNENEFFLVDWTDDFQSASACCENGGKLTQGLNGIRWNTLSMTEVNCELYGINLNVGENIAFSKKVENCDINAEGHTVSLIGQNIAFVGNSIVASFIHVSQDGVSLQTASISNNRINFKSTNGKLSVHNSPTSVVSVCGNTFLGSVYQPRILLSDVSEKVRVECNPGSKTSTIMHSEVKQIITSQARKVYWRKRSNENVWTTEATIIVIPVEQTDNYLEEYVYIGPIGALGTETFEGIRRFKISSTPSVFINEKASENNGFIRCFLGGYEHQQEVPTDFSSNYYFVMDNENGTTTEEIVKNDGIVESVCYLNNSVADITNMQTPFVYSRS